MLLLTFRTNEGEVLDVNYLGKVDIEACGVEPLLAGVTANHFYSLWLVANTVQLVRITLNY